VEEYCRAGQVTGDNMANAHCMLGTKGYKHTLGICNTVFPLQQRLHDRANFVALYEGWNFNSGNYLFTTDTK